MKCMFMSDLLVMRRNLIQSACILAVVILFLAIVSGPVMAAAIGTAMLPMFFLFNACGYESTGQWAAMRLTMPLKRRDVVLGRYASVFVVGLCGLVMSVAIGTIVSYVSVSFGLFQDAGFNMPDYAYESGFGPTMAAAVLALCAVLLMIAVVLPFLIRFGVTKATVFIPVLFALLIFGVTWVTNLISPSDDIALMALDMIAGDSGNVAWISGYFVAFVLAIYVASMLISIVLYRRRAL